MPAEHTVETPTEPIQDEANPTELKRVHTKEEKEKIDEPKAEPAAADEFGLPPRPPRRRTYTLEELDSPEDIKKHVIEETGGEVKEPVEEPEKDEAKDEEKKPETPRTSVDNARSSDKKRTSTDSKDPTSPKSPSSPSASRHKQQPSVTSVSEWSHQQMAPKETIVEEEKDEEDEWQEMPALATHRIYDDWGKVLAKEYDEVEDETVSYGTLGGAGKGYTRVQMDEDANSATSMDDNTAYLFKDQSASHTVYDEDEEGRNAVSQMQATKELLTEGQRIAYVGVVRLSIAAMSNEMDQLERTKNSKKAVNFAVEALKMWGQKMMLRFMNTWKSMRENRSWSSNLLNMACCPLT
ncbi:hypothetical protein MRB53_041063 [Persea americana]|nr:hypothetical protein MRB53_041063 [Persea americana]